MILIIAPEDDLHAVVVGQRLRDRGVPFTIWNTTWFPWRHRVTWSPLETHISCTNDLPLEQIAHVWWRRYRGPTLSPTLADEAVKRFCAGEASELLRGMFSSGIAITNDPHAEWRADSKILQLTIARSLGLTIPRTIVSNNREAIHHFLKAVGTAVLKPLLCDYPHSIETRACALEDFVDETTTRLAPTMVQERVPCAADIRVCVIGNRVFAAELISADENRIDWRLTASGWRPHTLPGNLEDKLRRMVDVLDLEMGSYDLRLTPEGEYVFFELNPNGQFLFLEVDADLPISQTVADYLAFGRDL
jgi:glutathione synthase/RimK-type ligase-like ATP-grasp enzyme